MNTIEMIVITITAILTFPYLCKLIKRPALVYCFYLLLGVALGDFLKLDTRLMIDEVGKVGFILLLFLVGLEIDLPPLAAMWKSFRFCLIWLGIQIPLFVLFSVCCGHAGIIGLIAGAGLSACSLGITYSLLESQRGILDESSKNKLLMGMVVLEIFSLFILAMSEVIYSHGWSIQALFRGAALIVFILLIRSFSGIIHRQLSRLVESSGRWKIHQILLILFGITMIGDRFGLSAAKTAFFLGLFMGTTTHNGIKFEDELKPIAQNVFIPIFFISLGSKILISHLFSYLLPIGLLIAVVLFVIRHQIFARLGKFEIPNRYFLLFCPNLTMVAVAAGILIDHGTERNVVDLLLATGFMITVGSALLFPAPKTSEARAIQEVDPEA